MDAGGWNGPAWDAQSCMPGRRTLLVGLDLVIADDAVRVL